ncbi:MAG: transcription elongation factor GreA [Pseudomonadota bacterium]
MNNRPPITQRGAEVLRKELQRLKTSDRPQVIEAIAAAREHGDLKENAEYHAAREQQSFIEGRIAEIEDQLARAQVIDTSSIDANGKVVFGATVTIVDVDNDQEMNYQIVGELEAEIKEGRISVSSPIARALIGRSEGDVVSVDAPGGTREYEIADVAYH